VPSHFCYIDGIALGRELTANQVPLLEPAMRAFQADPKTRMQLLNKFCRVAAGLIAAEQAKRRKTVQEGLRLPPPPEDPVKPLSAALHPVYLDMARRRGLPIRAPTEGVH